jgi:hypothetical protein
MYHNGMGKETQNQPKRCGVKSEMGKRRASVAQAIEILQF